MSIPSFDNPYLTLRRPTMAKKQKVQKKLASRSKPRLTNCLILRGKVTIELTKVLFIL